MVIANIFIVQCISILESQRLASVWLLSSPETPSAILWKSCHFFEEPFWSKEKLSTAYRISHLSPLWRPSIISSMVLNCWQNRRLLLSALQNLVMQRRTKRSNCKLEMWERKKNHICICNKIFSINYPARDYMLEQSDSVGRPVKSFWEDLMIELELFPKRWNYPCRVGWGAKQRGTWGDQRGRQGPDLERPIFPFSS